MVVTGNRTKADSRKTGQKRGREPQKGGMGCLGREGGGSREKSRKTWRVEKVREGGWVY